MNAWQMDSRAKTIIQFILLAVGITLVLIALTLS